MSKIILDTDVSWKIETNVGWVTGLPKVGTGYFEYTPIFSNNTGQYARTGNITITYYTPTPTVEVIPVTQTGIGGYRNAKVFIVGLEEDSDFPVQISIAVDEYQNTFSPKCNTELDISGFMGSQTIPNDKDNLRLSLYNVGSEDEGYKPFLHQLNHAYFIETNSLCTTYDEVYDLGAVELDLTYNGSDGYYVDATFNTGYDYAYFVLDYRNMIPSGVSISIDNLSAAFTTNFMLGSDNLATIVYGEVEIFPSDTNCLQELVYDGQKIFEKNSSTDSSINFIVSNKSNPYSILSISPPTTEDTLSNMAIDIYIDTFTLPSVTLSNTKRDYYYDCLPDTPTVSYFHTMYASIPDVGTQLYTNPAYNIPTFVSGWYRNSTYAFNLNSAGVVIERRLLACSEAGIPVLTAETFNIENGSDVEFKIVATNNPYKYRITSVYTDVSVLGGTTGGSWDYTDTEGATSIVNVGIGETVIVAGNYSTFTRTRGSNSTIVNGGQAALDGIFVTDDGVIKIGSDVGGTFSAVVVATNCVGNSANRTFTFIVSAPPVVPPTDVCCTSGIPIGGTAGQILSKIDATDYNTQWIDEAPAASFTSTVKHQVKLGLAIAKGQAVYVSSANGTNMVVSKADNTSEATSSKTMGLLETGGSTNAQVNVVTEGLLTGLNTSAATIGDPVWLGVGGALIYGLVNKPYAPAHLVFIGIVTRVNSSNGEIFVKPQNGFELREIHDIDLITNTPTNNQLLSYDSSTGLWANKSVTTASIAASTNKNYVTDAQATVIGNTSGTNTGDNAVNSLYSGLAASKQNTLVSGTNIKTVEGQSILGTGNIDITKTDVGLGSVDNTSDLSKPISTATQTALNAKEPTITAGITSQYYRGDKTFQTLDKTAVGLANVNNVIQEPALGNPSVNGQVLSSTTAGVRSWITMSGGGGTWGSITGTLSSQTDLQTALNAKQNTITNSDSITQGTTNLFLTSAERTKLTNTSGTNTGDNAVNTLYNSLAKILAAGNATNETNILSNNSQSVLKVLDTTIGMSRGDTEIYITNFGISIMEGSNGSYIELANGDVTITFGNTFTANGETVILQSALNTALANKQNTLTLTTTGTSGAATLVGSTLNIPQYSGDYLSVLSAAEIAITTTATATIGRQHLISGTSADYTVTLPAASGNTGKFIGFRISTSATRLFTIKGNGAELIDGLNTRIMWKGESAILYCDGTGWKKIAGLSIPMICQMFQTSINTTLFTHNNAIKVPLTGIKVNNTGLMANTGSNRINIVRGGYYSLKGAVSFNTFSANAPRALSQIQVTTVGVANAEASALATAYTTPFVTTDLLLTTSDYVELYGLQNSGVTQGVWGNASLVATMIMATEITTW